MAILHTPVRSSRRWALAVAACAAATAVLASPTANEYQQCHREAAAMLQSCLDEAPGARHGTRCWLRSRTTQQRCYQELRASHQRPPWAAARCATLAAPTPATPSSSPSDSSGAATPAPAAR